MPAIPFFYPSKNTCHPSSCALPYPLVERENIFLTSFRDQGGILGLEITLLIFEWFQEQSI
jgi:hypothetical protein